MTDPPPSQVVELLKSKALLVFQRDREVMVLNAARERAAAWLRVFHLLSIEAEECSEALLCEQWALLMIRQLQFQTAMAYLQDVATGAFRLVGGKSHLPLPTSVQLSPEALDVLSEMRDGVCDRSASPELDVLSRALGLSTFLWSMLSPAAGARHLLVVGFSPAMAQYQPQLTEDDLGSFQMLARHMSVLLSNSRLITELHRERRQLQVMNAQYAVANRELEAFSYSVSHDLRAPLRSIDGFSQALLEDCGPQLDSAGRDYARRVRAAAQRMGELIDDLLKLSRVSRAGLTRQDIDLSALARTVLDELSAREPGRVVQISIQEGLSAWADPHLVRILLDNLLGNAWKFTSRAAHAKIQVGVTEQQGQLTFWVQDNGAGFNAKYVERLFRPFQRLHSLEEFPGTGVGLATVRRIVDRHGGRVWAEGVPEQGATFYFTIPHHTNGDPG